MSSTPPLLVSVPTDAMAADLPAQPEVDVAVWDVRSPAPRDHLDIVVIPTGRMHETLPNLRGLSVRLVQGQSIGFDDIPANLPAGLTFANATSVHEASTAELAVALTLAAQRKIPAFVDAARRRQWEPSLSPSLADRRVTLLGFGGVGRAIAKRLSGFEVALRAIGRERRLQDGIEVHPITSLHSILAETDVLIISLPNNDRTRRLIDDTALAALPDSALVVNVGRGPVIDTDALVTHVHQRRLRAALDVTDPEPLPQDHALWDLDDVLLSPHVGGATDAMRPRIARLIERQIERMLMGEPPLNVVIDPKDGVLRD